MNKLHYYPALPKSGKYANPYSNHYRKALSEHFKVIDTQPLKGFLLPLQLVIAAWKADIYIFNWIENFTYTHLKHVQCFLLILCFRIIKWRKKSLIWMFHNIHPHTGAGKYSEKIMTHLLNNATLIVAHSKDAANYAQSQAKCKVIYKCHPIEPFPNKTQHTDMKKFDALIWGSILPYKGVVEFLSYLNSTHSRLSVYVAGKSKDETLTQAIKAECNEYVSFSNEYVDFHKLAGLISNSKFVVFPYIGNSVSSSGALIDTIAMGGNPVGPNKGAFKDIAEEGCCFVYNDYNELENILKSNAKIAKCAISTFVRTNSWKSFVESVINEL